jgi:ABC-2 type transport system permease protein
VIPSQTKNRQTIKLTVRSPGSAPRSVNIGATPVSRVWFNPDLRSRNYFVPGVAANILFMVTLMLTAQAIIREKEIGTMEQLMVTPMRPIELMLGKTLPFALVGLGNLVMITAGALLIFRVPFRGNFFVLLFSAAVFLMSSLGAGLFLSTISNTQQQANMMSFFFSSPAFMLSGFNFPIRNMPASVQYLTYLNPLRYFMEIVRGVFLKGVGLSILWPQVLALAVFGVLILWFSALRFHKSLD